MGKIEDLLRSHSEVFKKPEPVKLIFMNGQFIRDIDAVASQLKIEEANVTDCITKLARIIAQIRLTEDSSNSRPKNISSKFLSSKQFLVGGSKGYYVPASFTRIQSSKSLKLRQLHGFRTPQELTPETSVILDREKANKTTASAIKIDNKRYQQDILINLNQREQKLDTVDQPDEHHSVVKVERSKSKTHLDPIIESPIHPKQHRPSASNPSANESVREMITEFKKEDLATKIETKQTNKNDFRFQTPKFTVKESPIPTKVFKSEPTASPEQNLKPTASVSPSRSTTKKNTLNLSLASGIKQIKLAPTEQPAVENLKLQDTNSPVEKRDVPQLQNSLKSPQKPTDKPVQLKDQAPPTKVSGQEKSKPGNPPAYGNEKLNHVKFEVEDNKRAEALRDHKKQSNNKNKPAEDQLVNKTSLHEGVKQSHEPGDLNLLFKNTSTIEPLSPALLKKHSTNQSQLYFRGSSYENIQSHTQSNLEYFDAQNTSNNLSSRNKKKGNVNQQVVEFGSQQEIRGKLQFTQMSSDRTTPTSTFERSLPRKSIVW